MSILAATMIVSRQGEWLTITPEGYFTASTNRAQMLSVAQGYDVYAIVATRDLASSR